jgi:uncharacterized protein
MYPTFPTTESTILFPGPVGDIELLAAPADNATTTTIICHPHPLYGGTMTNKVVTTLARVFKDLGHRTIRFNFRGVGKSAGAYDHGKGELTDLLAIIDWVKTLYPNDALWLAGFSFGAYVATKGAIEVSPAQLVTVAPQVSRFVEDDLTKVSCPWVLVQGEQDEVVSPAEVFAWYETLNPKPKLIRMPDAGHFFHRKLVELREELKSALTK